MLLVLTNRVESKPGVHPFQGDCQAWRWPGCAPWTAPLVLASTEGEEAQTDAGCRALELTWSLAEGTLWAGAWGMVALGTVLVGGQPWRAEDQAPKQGAGQGRVAAWSPLKHLGMHTWIVSLSTDRNRTSPNISELLRDAQAVRCPAIPAPWRPALPSWLHLGPRGSSSPVLSPLPQQLMTVSLLPLGGLPKTPQPQLSLLQAAV